MVTGESAAGAPVEGAVMIGAGTITAGAVLGKTKELEEEEAIQEEGKTSPLDGALTGWCGADAFAVASDTVARVLKETFCFCWGEKKG